MNDIIKALQFEKEQLEARIRLLEDKIESDNRQISEYDHELRQAKRLLKAAVEDINYYVDCYEAHCDECCCDHDNHCHWKHADEALALIGEEGGNNA